MLQLRVSRSHECKNSRDLYLVCTTINKRMRRLAKHSRQLPTLLIHRPASHVAHKQLIDLAEPLDSSQLLLITSNPWPQQGFSHFYDRASQSTTSLQQTRRLVRPSARFGLPNERQEKHATLSATLC
jgi:hypothetical protein